MIEAARRSAPRSTPNYVQPRHTTRRSHADEGARSASAAAVGSCRAPATAPLGFRPPAAAAAAAAPPPLEDMPPPSLAQTSPPGLGGRISPKGSGLPRLNPPSMRKHRHPSSGCRPPVVSPQTMQLFRRARPRAARAARRPAAFARARQQVGGGGAFRYSPTKWWASSRGCRGQAARAAVAVWRGTAAAADEAAAAGQVPWPAPPANWAASRRQRRAADSRGSATCAAPHRACGGAPAASAPTR